MSKNLSRREWLKLAGAGIAGLALFPGEVVAEEQPKAIGEPTTQEWERALEGVSLEDGGIVPVDRDTIPGILYIKAGGQEWRIVCHSFDDGETWRDGDSPVLNGVEPHALKWSRGRA